MSLLRNTWQLYKGITLYLPIIIGAITAYTIQAPCRYLAGRLRQAAAAAS